MGKALTKSERNERIGAVQEKLLSRQEDFARALNGMVPVEVFVQAALTSVVENEKLAECSVESILLACLKAAQSGLRLDNRQATLIPYGGVATFLPMVQGVLDLIVRNPDVAKAEARAVFDGDVFEYEYGLRPNLIHKPSKERTDGREVVFSYAIVFLLNGHHFFEVIGRDDIEKARLSSKAPESPAWKRWYGEMARKVAVHRISKYVDLAPQAASALGNAIEAEFSVNDPGDRRAAFADGAADTVGGQLNDLAARVAANETRAAEVVQDSHDEETREVVLAPEEETDSGLSTNDESAESVEGNRRAAALDLVWATAKEKELRIEDVDRIAKATLAAPLPFDDSGVVDFGELCYDDLKELRVALATYAATPDAEAPKKTRKRRSRAKKAAPVEAAPEGAQAEEEQDVAAAAPESGLAGVAPDPEVQI